MQNHGHMFFQFSGVGSAEVVDRVAKLPAGFDGVVRLTRTEVKNTRTEGPKFFVEFDVVESTNMPQLVGGHYSWGQSTQKVDVMRGNMKRFFLGAIGVRLDDEANVAAWSSPVQPGSNVSHIDNGLMQACQAPDQNQLIGRLARLRTEQREGQQSKRAYIAHFWDAL